MNGKEDLITKNSFSSVIVWVLLAFVLSGCATAKHSIPPTLTSSPIPFTPTSSPIPPTNTPSPLPPTYTPTPIPPTATQEPTSTITPLPGLAVFSVDTLGKNIPWLPLEPSVRPAVNFVAFNFLKPPFNDALVRQAFAHAIDRQVLVDMALRYRTNNPKPATSLTPPEILGRDLYNEVGARFDPQKAKELLAEAGYADPSTFPTVTMIVNAYGDIAPGARFNMANAMVEMWQTHLGVTVEVKVIADFKDYGNRLKTDPPEIFWQGWVADVNDPDNFLREMFHSGSPVNYGHFLNYDFDLLVDKAAQSRDPAYRQDLYIQAERLLCETEAALIPLYHFTYNIP